MAKFSQLRRSCIRSILRPSFHHRSDGRPPGTNGTREELFRGRLVLAAPALLPHARRQAQVVSVANHASAADCESATELLTCTGSDTNFATDACILRKGIDPATGARYLEELAFEVVAEQTLRDITERAQDLAARGVRRIIAIFVKTDEVREWSRERGDWITLDPNDTIEDRTLAAPLPVRALLDRVAANRAVVRGLYAKQEPARKVARRWRERPSRTSARSSGFPSVPSAAR